MTCKPTKATCSACRGPNHLPQAHLRAPAQTASPLWCHQPPDLRLTTRNPRLMSDIRRPSSMTSSTMSHKLLRVPLRQQRRYQSLSIRNGPSKASSNTAGSGMM
ncbi:hypothetical protein V8E51_012706 [Hyaloscypha variabilis]